MEERQSQGEGSKKDVQPLVDVPSYRSLVDPDSTKHPTSSIRKAGIQIDRLVSLCGRNSSSYPYLLKMTDEDSVRM